MPYRINFTDPNKGFLTIEDNLLNQSTSLNIPGKGYIGYGVSFAENLLQLLENYANIDSPNNPIEGQLWFDSSESARQLKIFDGNTWKPAGGLIKSPTEPLIENSATGDLWVNSNTQQLFLFNGASWSLIGPQISDTVRTGIAVENVLDSSDIERPIIIIRIDTEAIMIISRFSFIPKTSIRGFSSIRAGINITGIESPQSSFFKIFGTVEKAENLVVNQQVVASSKFIRNDVESTISKPFSIRDDLGLYVGRDRDLRLYVEGVNSVLANDTSGGSIYLRVNNQGEELNPISIFSDGRIGINKSNPVKDLEIIGDVEISGETVINDDTNSSDIGSGALVVKGGIGIEKNVNIGGNLNVAGSINITGITSETILPKEDNTYDLGSLTNRWKSVRATNFVGTLTGNLIGNASRADRLNSTTTFVLDGDVSSNPSSFDGTGSEQRFTTVINQNFITTKEEQSELDSNSSDEILVYKTSAPSGLKKISKKNFLSGILRTSGSTIIPIGSIFPYAGTTAPNGWLFCDGAIVSRAEYFLLYEIIGQTYDSAGEVQNTTSFFKIPDFRGRFPLGLDNMGTTGSANRVNLAAGSNLGNANGFETKTLNVNNLPNHVHDLKAAAEGAKDTQFYAIKKSNDNLSDPNVIVYDSPTATNSGEALNNSGGIKDFSSTQPINIMNPFIAINYIIFTGKF